MSTGKISVARQLEQLEPRAILAVQPFIGGKGMQEIWVMPDPFQVRESVAAAYERNRNGIRS